MQQYKIAVLGCGAIFSRHLSAILNNADHYKLVGLFDINTELSYKYKETLKVKVYNNEHEVYLDNDINCVVILTPNDCHFNQAKLALINKKNVILEKPATFIASQVNELEHLALQNNVKIFGILQVRLNPSVIILKEVMLNNLLGRIRGCSIIQRWQRPLSYFTGWRGNMATGGGILREFAIHYLDVMQYLLGNPKVIKACFYKNKFFNTDVDDTVYSLFDFNGFGGTMEISIAAEPKNIECTLSIMGEYGFVKLGGKSLDEIIIADFDTQDKLNTFNDIKNLIMSQQTAVLATSGASPYHPELYRQIIINPSKFYLNQMYNVINLIEQIYNQ